MTAVVIGIGNPHRRDDGIGPAVAESIARQGLPGVRVLGCAAEPTEILDAWSGADLAVLVDATAGLPSGLVAQCRIEDLAETAPVSSHDLSLTATYELGRALGRAPESVIIVAVGVADTGHGVGLSRPVIDALPDAVRMVRAALVEQTEEAANQQP